MRRNEYSFTVLIMHYAFNSDNSFFSFRLFAKNLKFEEQKFHTSHNDEILKKNNNYSHSFFRLV